MCAFLNFFPLQPIISWTKRFLVNGLLGLAWRLLCQSWASQDCKAAQGAGGGEPLITVLQ